MKLAVVGSRNFMNYNLLKVCLHGVVIGSSKTSSIIGHIKISSLISILLFIVLILYIINKLISHIFFFNFLIIPVIVNTFFYIFD